jgi:hypothetical protein
MIGCPVYGRDWILPYWFKAIEAQDYSLEKVGFIFLVSPRGDDQTRDCLFEFQGRHPELRCFDIITDDSPDHMGHVDGGGRRRRTWTKHRYGRMAQFRNQILEKVVCHNPDRYFSLDSDILLEDPATLSKLVELTKDRNAVAPLCFMVPPGGDASGKFPNVMWWAGGNSKAGGYRKPGLEYGTLFQADIIMASVMMDRDTYTRARYKFHQQGEDLGWASNCASLGLSLWSASNIYAAHVMYKEELEEYLRVGDPRSSLTKG